MLFHPFIYAYFLKRLQLNANMAPPDTAIQIPAKIGSKSGPPNALSRPAANGSITAQKMSAQKMLPFIALTARREIFIASARSRRSFRTRIICAHSSATAEPVPIATPTSAAARAAASLVLSPTMATFREPYFSLPIMSAFLSGDTPAAQS